MAGGNHPKSSSQKPPSSSSSSHHRKSRWESNSNAKSPSNPKPSATTTAAVAGNPKQLPQQPSKPSPTTASAGIPSQPSRPGPSPSPASHHAPQPGQNALIPQPGAPFPFPDPSHLGPPPPPSYGFQMLDRRTIVLADGSVRSYFALPHDYRDSIPPIRPPPQSFGPGEGFRGERHELYGRGIRNQDYWNSLELDARGGVSPPHEGLLKRKYVEEERDGIGRDEFARHRQQLL